METNFGETASVSENPIILIYSALVNYFHINMIHIMPVVEGKFCYG